MAHRAAPFATQLEERTVQGYPLALAALRQSHVDVVSG
jgi:hypothetical protein